MSHFGPNYSFLYIVVVVVKWLGNLYCRFIYRGRQYPFFYYLNYCTGVVSFFLPRILPFYVIFVEKSRKFFLGKKVFFFQKFPGRVGGSREYDRAEEEGTPPPHPPPPPSIRKEESEREELVLVLDFSWNRKNS